MLVNLKTVLTFAYFVFCFWLPSSPIHFFLPFSSLKPFHFFFKICLNIAATKHPFFLCLRSFTIVVIHKKKRKERGRGRERRRKKFENFAFFKLFFGVCANEQRQEEHTQVTDFNDHRFSS
jgi:hypothetical protein